MTLQVLQSGYNFFSIVGVHGRGAAAFYLPLNDRITFFIFLLNSICIYIWQTKRLVKFQTVFWLADEL